MNSATPRPSFKSQIIFWSTAFLIVMLCVWLFSPILTPFVLGAIIAYLLNPLVNLLAHWKLSRRWAATLILSGFLILLAAFLALTIPLVLKEMGQFINDLPAVLSNLQDTLVPYIEWIRSRMGLQEDAASIRRLLQNNAETALQASQGLAQKLAAGSIGFLNLCLTLVVTVIAAFFMINEWPRLQQWCQDMIPDKHRTLVLGLWSQIDRKIAGFIRGQLTVCFVLGVIYAIALTVADLNYGFLIGIFAGLFSIIPLVGSTLGLLVSISVAWFQSQSLGYVALIAGIFIIGQLVEGNYVTPKIMGKSVGLHPLWILFALMAGGALFGVAGMLLAVPFAAAVSVLLEFAIRVYKQSPFYHNGVKPEQLAAEEKAE